MGRVCAEEYPGNGDPFVDQGRVGLPAFWRLDKLDFLNGSDLRLKAASAAQLRGNAYRLIELQKPYRLRLIAGLYALILRRSGIDALDQPAFKPDYPAISEALRICGPRQQQREGCQKHPHHAQARLPDWRGIDVIPAFRRGTDSRTPRTGARSSRRWPPQRYRLPFRP